MLKPLINDFAILSGTNEMLMFSVTCKTLVCHFVGVIQLDVHILRFISTWNNLVMATLYTVLECIAELLFVLWCISFKCQNFDDPIPLTSEMFLWLSPIGDSIYKRKEKKESQKYEQCLNFNSNIKHFLYSLNVYFDKRALH